MGGGSSVEYGDYSPKNAYAELVELEDLCRKGLNSQAHQLEQYRAAVTSAIRTNRLDFLEILLVGGNARLAMPLHIAATYGKLDSCELLLSAGFDPLSIDKSTGYTPLHLAAMNRSFESGLCAHFLCLAGGTRLMSYRDRDSNLPTHIAVERNNEVVLRALLENNVIVDKPNKRGYLPRELALKLGHTELVRMIDDHIRQPLSTRLTSTAETSRGGEISTERMMEVWEKFFENAMKGFEEESLAIGGGGGGGGLLVDVDGFSTASSRVSGQTRSFTSDGKSNKAKTDNLNGLKKQEKQRQQQHQQQQQQQQQQQYDFVREQSLQRRTQGNTTPTPTSTSTSTSYNKSNKIIDVHTTPPPHTVTIDPRLFEWFQWIACYSEANANDPSSSSSSGYYVCHRSEGGSKWLDSHLRTQKRLGIYASKRSPVKDNISRTPTGGSKLDMELELELEVGTSEYPSNVEDLVRQGWMTYYDSASNQCYWLNTSTYELTTYMPIGLDAMAKALGYFVPYEETSPWVLADQKLSTTWIVVVMTTTTTTTATATAAAGALVSESDSLSKPSGEKGAAPANANAVANVAAAVNDRPQQQRPSAARAQWEWDEWQESQERQERDNRNNDNYKDKDKDKYNDKDKDNDTCFYYSNRVTGHTSWTQPPNFEAVSALWGQWLLCCSQESDPPWAPFYWHPESGECVYAEVAEEEEDEGR